MSADPRLAELDAVLAAAFGAGQVRATAVLRAGLFSLVAAGQDASGAPVIIKRLFDADTGARSAHLTRLLVDQPEHLAALAGDGRFRLAQWLLMAPSAGIGVQQRAPGQRLDAMLGQGDAAARAAALELAGGWLAAFGRGRSHPTSVAWRQLLRRRREAMPPDLPLGDTMLVAEVLRRLHDMLPALQGMQVLQSVSHGDFALHNLHLAPGPQLWAHDLQPARRRPMLADGAQLLAAAALHRPHPGPLLDGLPAADRAALLAGLAAPEQDPAVLRFLIADALLRHLAEAGPAPERLAACRAAIAGWLGGSA